ncbi:TcpQ domain-containing protein [Catenovulum maritimum]|uniref:Toxin co-regulated pilus biosynthesis protein Q C-terminal domain-containing protein n=1 Tax=Catenovulum maritimum TaxID=1513271 RepID=A0A0J8GQY9_9ALTE|nr:TcpQ domain-containing protein [Catenovulum maritimum]KMT65117.1 hypothetical protein XM47_10280 [Catenovulum maritimum]
MWFWIRHLAAAAFLIFLGVYVIFYEAPSYDVKTKNSDATSSNFSTTTNAAAKGLSDFYAELKRKFEEESNPDGQQFVIHLKRPNSTLTNELKKIGTTTQPMSKNWVGERKNRRFVAGDTLRNRLEHIAEEENVNLIWWLDRDFVVKLAFRVDETAVGTLYKMATAIDSDFEQDVHGLFCPRQRTLVITDKIEHFVRQNCVPARSADSNIWHIFR